MSVFRSALATMFCILYVGLSVILTFFLILVFFLTFSVKTPRMFINLIYKYIPVYIHYTLFNKGIYMAKNSRGTLSGRSRNLARHHKPSSLRVRDIIKDYKIGDRVAIVPKGNTANIPHPRYKGKVGVIKEKRGRGYVVEINSMRSKKLIIVHSIHVEKIF